MTSLIYSSVHTDILQPCHYHLTYDQFLGMQMMQYL